jgi:glycosyltransferase involved in cell wall biosynthesis
VAWVGPTPTTQSGVTYAATQALLALAERGVRIDCFVAEPPDRLPEILRERPEITFLSRRSWWRWGRWYSRSPFSSMLSGLVARSMTQYQLIAWMARRHARRPYDVVYQFGQIELLGLGTFRRRLPGIMLHPGTHAAGEVRWHRREAALGRRAGERPHKRAVVQTILAVRAIVQRRDIRRVRLTVALSHVFAGHLARDYGVASEALRVVPYAVDLERFRPASPTSAHRPIVLIFVCAMSARKGVEMIIDLSRGLGDLAGQVRIEAVGGARQWSDYRPLLSELDPRVARGLEELDPADLVELYRRADALLQPSHYEPFGLTVAEALASGIPVVASDEVGATEGVDPSCCRVFQAGDGEAFEAAVRRLVADLRGSDRDVIRESARNEAKRLFARAQVGGCLVSALESVANRKHDVAGR